MAIEFYGIAEKIDALVQEYSPENLEAIEERFVVKGIEYYFFIEKLTKLEDPFTWLIPLKDKKYFAGEKNPPPQEVKGQPGFYTMPFWNVLPYLEYVGKKNREKLLPEITNALSEVVDSIINYKDEKRQRIDNYRTDWFITKIIFMLPSEKWSERHIDFIGMGLRTSFGGSLIQSEIGKNIIPALIENKAINLIPKLFNVILGFTKISQDNRDKIKPLMDKHWLHDALKKYKKEIAELCGPEAVEIGLNTIKSVLKEDEGKFSFVWIPTIEDSSQNKFPDNYECQLVFFVRDIFEDSKPEKIRSTVEGLFKEEHNIFKRLAIHTINHHYGQFKDLFWKWQGNPLDEHGCKNEFYQLLKANSSSFSKEEIRKVLEWIESKNYGDFDQDRAEKALAYYKKEWLSTLLETNDPDVISKNKEYDQKDPTKLHHPGLLSWSESWSGVISPIQPDELLKKSNEEIAGYVKTWKEEDRWHGPSQDGLRDCLKKCVSENPDKFTKNMRPFFEVQPIYQQSILQGFYETRNTAEIFWKDVLDFITQIIEPDEFWNEKYEKEGYNYRNWMISTIAELIEKGANYEGNIFGNELLPHIGKILLKLVEKTKAEPPQMKSLIDSVLNSPKGKIFSAMIHYSFYYARLNKNKEVKWPETIKNDFTKRLDKEFEPSLDYSVTLGRYLPNLFYLDQQWVIENFENIFPKENESYWQAVIGGYLSYGQRVYPEIYHLLKKNNHLRKALETKFEDRYISEKLVQNICIGFIEDWEKLEDAESLICLLLNKGNVDQLSELIHFLWTIKEGETLKKVKEKIKPLWRALFDLASKHENDRDYQSLISKVNLWLDIIDEIDDDIKQWIMLTAKFVNVDFHASELVERLSKHVEKTPQNVAEIYIEMLNTGSYTDYEQEDIIKIVDALYQKGYKKYADSICNKYGEVGYYFLRNLYEQYNN